MPAHSPITKLGFTCFRLLRGSSWPIARALPDTLLRMGVFARTR